MRDLPAGRSIITIDRIELHLDSSESDEMLGGDIAKKGERDTADQEVSGDINSDQYFIIIVLVKHGIRLD